MTDVILTVGVSASGKSTWAETMFGHSEALGIECVVLCRDDIRKEILGITDGSLWDHWKFTRENEDKVTQIFNKKLDVALSRDCLIILADTNLNSRFRNQLIDKCQESGAFVTIKDFPIALHTAVERDSNRLHSVGKDVITKQFQQWQKYVEERYGSGIKN